MGDSGSEVLGFSVAFLGLDFVATKGATLRPFWHFLAGCGVAVV
jgi:hypothetical protein